jgi:hypothetical protein
MSISIKTSAVLAAAAVSIVGERVASAQSQYTLQKANSFNLSTLFAAGTGYGSNPLSVAVDSAGNAYVGGYNSSAAAANIGIVKVTGSLSASPTVAGLANTQFSSPASRGLDALASVGGNVYALHDSGTAATGFIERLDASGNNAWTRLDPGAGQRVSTMAIDPIGDAGGPAVGFNGFGNGRRATLHLADGTSDYTFGTGAKPGGIINTSPALPNQGNWRAMAFDSTGQIAMGSEAGFGVGARVSENVWSTLDGSQQNFISRITLKGNALNNVGNGITFLQGAATDELIAFSPRGSGSGAGIDTQSLTDGLGGVTTVNTKFVQIRQTRGQKGYLTQTQLTGAEDLLGTAYAGEVKNFATGVDANGNPALYVVDYFTKQLDVYTIEPRYSLDADSTWSNPAAWTLGIVPNSSTTNATFAGGTTGQRGIVVDGNKTVKQLKFDSANTYSLNGASTITLAAPANDGHLAAINVINGSHTVNAPIVLGSNTQIVVANSGDTLTTGTITGSGTGFVKRGPGTAAIGRARVNVLAIEAGIVRLNPNGTDAGLSRSTSLSLGTTGPTPTVGFLDITNNGLVVDYAPESANPYADIKAAITGGTITSSALDSNHTIGIVDYTLTTPPTFADPTLTIDATSVFIRQTIRGDATLNRSVGFDDLIPLAQNYNTATGALYQQGDADGNGTVDFQDLVILAQNYGASALADGSITVDTGMAAGFAGDWALAQSLVPEPTSLMLAAIGLPVLTRRRR